jgi:hypothetical protein
MRGGLPLLVDCRFICEEGRASQMKLQVLVRRGVYLLAGAASDG